MKRYIICGIAVGLSIALLFACKHKPPTPQPADGNYPDDVAAIILNKCAISGCHNQASYTGAHELLMDTWGHLFDGGINGAEVVPYQPRYSPLLYFVNTDPSLGLVSVPTMPQSTPGRHMDPLTKDEYMVLYNWIASGAPNKDGEVPFSSNPDTRQKIYLTQQGCDLLAVIDAEKKVVMRYIPIGMNPSNPESPHCVRVSDDGMYAYVSFLGSNFVQKIDTRTDAIVSSVSLAPVLPGDTAGSWNIIYISPGDTTILASNWTGNGLIATLKTQSKGQDIIIDPDPRKVYKGSGLFVYPHGIESNATFDTVFVTAQYGNIVYKFKPRPPLYYKQISINGSAPSASGTDSTNLSAPNPHEILMTPDRSKYFLTCQTTNEVRVLDAHNDAILAAMPVGTFPQELAMSRTKPYMFVTCMEEPNNSDSGRKGSVWVINYNTLQVVTTLYGNFYQPHGVAVDDKNGVVYIASTNSNPNGPAPHHASACTGRNGWYSIYDLNTLKPVNNKSYQVSVMPYSAATRFK